MQDPQTNYPGNYFGGDYTRHRLELDTLKPSYQFYAIEASSVTQYEQTLPLFWIKYDQ